MSKGPSGTLLEMPAVVPGSIPGGRTATPADAPRPYVFPRLEKIPRAQVDLVRRLQWLLPEGLLSGEAGKAIEDRLHRVFDEDVHLWLDYVHAVAPRTLPRLTSDPTVLGVVAVSPHRARGLVELELVLAHGIIDLLLGAPGESVAARPLTEIEQGVISYLLLELFKALSPSTSESGRDRMRLERLVPKLDDALELFADETSVAVVEFKVLIGSAAGYLRLMLPWSVVSTAVPPESSPERRSRRSERVRKNLKRLAGVRGWLRAEIGATELTGSDLVALRAGDVLLVDSLTTRSDLGESGTALLRVGMGRAGRMPATLELVDGHYQARIDELVLGIEPVVVDPDDEAAETLAEQAGDGAPAMADDHTTNPGEEVSWESEKTSVTLMSDLLKSDGQSDGAELLNDVPLQVAVELARVAVTAEEIVDLHIGRIIELGRGPGEPVDLSVNGKIVARGELVEIEGQLGVRILSLSE